MIVYKRAANWQGLLLIMILIILCIQPHPSLAETDWISSHITVEAYIDGEWKELNKNLLYSHENGVLADGILHFSPFLAYLEDYPAPQMTITNLPYYRISYDSYIDSFNSSVSFYEIQDGNLVKLKDENNEALHLQDLGPGTYVMAIDVQGVHGYENYTGACFAWVTIEK